MSREQMRAAALLLLRQHHTARRGPLRSVPWRPAPRPRPWYRRLWQILGDYWRSVRWVTLD